MSLNGTSEAKKRKLPNHEENILESSTKKIKVQAQRKFAQNAVTPTSTPQKSIQTPVVLNNVPTKPPIKRPNTEDFLTFLCFRGTSLLPPRLDFFNKPQRSLSAQEIAAGKKRRKSTPILPVSSTNNANIANNKPNERKNIRQLPQTKFPLTKLGQKVIGRNLVRSSSRYTVRQLALRHVSKIKKPKPKINKPIVETNVKKEVKKKGKQVSLDGKKIQTLKGRITRSNSLPSICYPAVNQLRDERGKWCKGGSSKSSSKTSEDSKDNEEERLSRQKTASTNLDQRSNSLSNMKRKASDAKCKEENKIDRKTRSLAGKHKSTDQDNYVVPDKKSDTSSKTISKSNKANSLIETKLTVDMKRRPSSVDNIKTSHESKDTIIGSTRSRPPRRTKEAATLFMEMLRKDMRCPDEQEDDDSSSVESFPDLPNTRINEQRERELKVFSKKKKLEKQLEEQKLSENNDINKKTVVEKKTVKGKKKAEDKTIAKTKMKELAETIVITENGSTTKFKRNLRPRRSSIMLDDYIIMTDSEEDEDESEPVVEVKTYVTPKSSEIRTVVDSKSQKCKFSAKESDKKNLKINKTDLKPKKDLNKIDSEVKKSLSETKSKSISLKRDKEPEIKNIKNAAVDKKTEKLLKHKTEIVVITKEPKTTSNCSKNSGKKVPPLNKHQLTKKESTANKTKSNLDLYNNNSKKKRSTSSMSSVASSSSSMFSSCNTSQTKEKLLERMAENFDVKPTATEKADEKAAATTEIVTTKTVESKDVLAEKVESAIVVEKNTQSNVVVAEKKIPNSVVVAEKKKVVPSSVVIAEKKTHSSVVKVDKKNVQSSAVVAVNKNTDDDDDEKTIGKSNKHDLRKVTKMENVVVAKEENVMEKVENALMVINKGQKTESLVMLPFNKMEKIEKVENIVFQTIAKDLLQHKQFEISVPEYLTGKSFQLPNRFKQDDGLSVLSEICSALPRFNEPFVSNRQLLNKLPMAGESSFVKYAPPPPPPLPSPVPTGGGGDEKKKDEKRSVPADVPVPQSFESRTMKIVSLARGGSAAADCCTAAAAAAIAVTDDKKDLATSWRRAFKNVKLPKNGFASAAVSVGNNLISWTKKKPPNLATRTADGSVVADDGSCDGRATETVADGGPAKAAGAVGPKSAAPANGGVVAADNGAAERSNARFQKSQYSGEPKGTTIAAESGGASCDGKKGTVAVASSSSYLAKTTILNSTKYDLKFEKRSAAPASAAAAGPAGTAGSEKQQRKDVAGDCVSSSDDQSPEKKIFHQRRLSATQSFSGNSSDAFSPDNETSVYAFQPDLPVASTPFRRNKPQSPAKSRTVSPNTSIAVSIENDSMEEKSHQSAVSSSTDVDSEEGRLFYIPLPAGVPPQPQGIQGVTVKLGTEGPQNKLVMSAKLVTKPPASTIPVSSISPKLERKIKPLCTTKIANSTTPVGTVQPTTRTVQPPKCTPSTSKQVLPLPLQPEIPEIVTKDEHKRLQQNVTTTHTTTANTTTNATVTTTFTTTTVTTFTTTTATTFTTTIATATATTISTAKGSKKSSISSSSSSASVAVNKKPKKTEKQVVNNKRKSSEKVASKKKSLKGCADMLDAPTFYPSEEDFKDPLAYFEIVKPVAQRYGICRVVPPASFKPECKVTDDMRFTAYNQYVHKMMNRWGPNVREMIAIKKYLETQSIVLSNPPLIGGMEVDLPRLYHTVQDFGGLMEVIELDKWTRVADTMKIPKSAQDRIAKLDDIYCKYLLPYDTISHEERQKLIGEVDKEWKQICKKGDTEDETYENINDCITKGRSIALNAYYRVARNTVAMWFREQQLQQPQGGHSSVSNKLGAAAVRAEDVESLYWKQVQDGKNHICVLSGSIDSGAEGYGFPTTKTATFTKHPWNLKVLTNNPVSVLRSLGPVMGMTVPTIHMGMVFSACCWYKDPHGLPWIEYLHTGADKVWYGVPSSESDKFRIAMKRLLPRAVAEGQNHHTWLAADSGMVPPNKLLEHGVTLTRTVQKPGQFLIVMPRAYTCNVSTGYVISESVYFTQSGWLNGAEKIFRDLQRNCEPAAFSFEKLLINMSTDSRTPQNILKQLLNILSNTRDCEVALRSQLVEDLGLKASERIQPVSSKSNVPTEEYECDVCHSILYISMVNNSHEDCNYCLRHGIEFLSKKHNQLKYCKFLYTFDEVELDSILVKLRERIDSKKKKTIAKS